MEARGGKKSDRFGDSNLIVLLPWRATVYTCLEGKKKKIGESTRVKTKIRESVLAKRANAVAGVFPGECAGKSQEFRGRNPGYLCTQR